MKVELEGTFTIVNFDWNSRPVLIGFSVEERAPESENKSKSLLPATELSKSSKGFQVGVARARALVGAEPHKCSGHSGQAGVAYSGLTNDALIPLPTTLRNGRVSNLEQYSVSVVSIIA